MKLILASSSQFRKNTLDLLGLKYEILPAGIDESNIRHENPENMATLIAKAKAELISQSEKNAIIISVDLFIIHNNSVLEKPASIEEAKSMLSALSESKFKIITGLTVLNSKTGEEKSCVESCEVAFRKINTHEIDSYVSNHPVLKFAGAFDATGLLLFSEKLSGNFNFQVG